MKVATFCREIVIRAGVRQREEVRRRVGKRTGATKWQRTSQNDTDKRTWQEMAEFLEGEG